VSADGHVSTLPSGPAASRIASIKVCDITFTVAQHDFSLTFHVVRHLHAVGIVLGFPWLDDEQATLRFGTECVYALMDGTVVETQVVVRRPECLLMPSTKVQRLMRKSTRAKGRTAEFFAVHLAVHGQHNYVLVINSTTRIERIFGRCCLMTSHSYFNRSTHHMLVDLGNIQSVPLVQCGVKGLTASCLIAC
jgi:hypothetical protein